MSVVTARCAALVFLTICPAAAQPISPPSQPRNSPPESMAKPTPAAPAKVNEVQRTFAEGLLGQPVLDSKGDTVGHIVDVLISADGTPHAAVMEFTGFFGIGNRRVAVAWDTLKFAAEQDHIVIKETLDPDQLAKMPEYAPEAKSVPVATPKTDQTKSAPQPTTPKP
ncbi:MAG TPA: PRC-barrel domain-containing protein [Acetobacteraceae bacterium]|nr:PRC-barrel domain-containing protein [Acetobacteraceae bacterium]